MASVNNKFTKNVDRITSKHSTAESKLGFLPEWIEDASIGKKDSKGKKHIYRKLDKKLKISANNYKRQLDVYFSSAEIDDSNRLLNFLLPKQKS